MKVAIELETGDLVDGRYRIEKVLGAGGSGAVYAATDEADAELGQVAIKILSSGESDEYQHEALLLEFALLGRLSHPNIVTALAIGRAESGATYLVEELVDGPTLDEVRESLDTVDYFELAHGILEGLSHIHRRGWVHHDIKPSNVLLERLDPERDGPISGVGYQPKLADLGVASLRGTDPLGQVSGTIPFLSPERLVGRLADPRSDIWALGMSLLFCITDKLPVDVSSIHEAAQILRTKPLPALRDLVPDAPAGLERVIGRMLARDGRARYRDGAEALRDLRREMSEATLAVPVLSGTGSVHRPALIGREQALHDVLSRLVPGRVHSARLVVVRGDRGSGRTRFLSEVALEAQLSGARAVYVRPGVSLVPWHRALREVGHDVAAHRVEAIAAAVQSVLREHPVVFLIDDLDTRDSASHRILERVHDTRVVASHVGGVVATSRIVRDWSERAEFERDFPSIELARLSDSEIGEAAISILGDDIGPATINRLCAAAEGSPARLLSTIDHAIESEAMRLVAGSWELDPNHVLASHDDHASWEAIEALGIRARETLLVLAILGPSGAAVEAEMVCEVAKTGRDETIAAISSLVHLGLAELTGTGQPTTTRIVIAANVAERVGKVATDDVRRQLHWRAWQAYEKRGDSAIDPAVLARHAWGADRHRDAIERTAKATMAALADHDHASVLALTDQLALDKRELDEKLAEATASPAASVLATLTELRCARAHALVELSRPQEGRVLANLVIEAQLGHRAAMAIAVRAAVVAGDAKAAAAALDALAGLENSKSAGQQRASAPTELEALELKTLAVEVGRMVRPPAEVAALADETIDFAASLSANDAVTDERRRSIGRVETAAGAALALGGDLGEGVTRLSAGLAAFEDLGDLTRVAEASSFLAAAADLGGNEKARADHLRRGLEAASAAGADSAAARLLNVRGLSNMWAGQTELAIEAFSEAERRGRRAGLHRVVSAVTGNLVVVYRRSALYGSALTAGRRSSAVKKSYGDSLGLTATTLNLADVYFDLGAYMVCAAAARRVIAAATQNGQRRVVQSAHITLAGALAARSEVRAAKDALAVVRAAAEPIDHRASLEASLVRAMIDAARGDVRACARRLQSLERRAHERDEPFLAASAACRRGVLLGPDGVPDLRRAIETASQCSANHLLWIARAQLGIHLQRSSQGGQAHLARAAEVLETVLADLPSRYHRRYLSGHRSSLVEALEAGDFPEPSRLPSIEPYDRTTSGASISGAAATIHATPSGRLASILVTSDSRKLPDLSGNDVTGTDPATDATVRANMDPLGAEGRSNLVSLESKTRIDDLGDLWTLPVTDKPATE